MTIKCSTFLDTVCGAFLPLGADFFPDSSLGTVPHQKDASALALLIAGEALAILCLSTGALAPNPCGRVSVSVASSLHGHGCISV